MRVQEHELSELVSRLPDIQLWSSDDSAKRGDIFVCALGFEPRCLTVPELLARSGARYRIAVKLRYSTNTADNAKNETALDAVLRQIAPEVHELNVDEPNFTKELRNVLNASASSESEPSVVVDISVFANRFILRCMKALLDTEVHLTIAYAEAESYYPTKEEYESSRGEWRMDSVLGLERGVREVSTSVDHPGYHIDSLPDRVILFPTFKPERSMAVVSAVDPSILLAPTKKVIWMLGLPHLPENGWRLNAVREINAIPVDASTYEVSTFQYKQTLQVLESIHRRYANEAKLTISPLGSKLQALATSLFCYMRPDVRVMFAIPKEYNAAHFSRGTGTVWRIAFGELSDLRKNLDSIGTLFLTR